MSTSKKVVSISTEMRKVKTLLKEIPEERKPIANSLYNELTFIEETMKQLKEKVKEDGPVTLFRQGSNEYYREHPALKSYNSLVQRFSLLYKQLVDLMPKTEPVAKSDELMDFLKD